MSFVSFELKFPDLAGKLLKADQELKLFVAAMMQTNRGMLFDREGAYNGHKKWAPLVFRQGQILSNRGVLRQSLAPSSPTGRPGPDGIVEFGNGVVTIGTNLVYARLMNDGTVNMPGGVLRPVNAKALKIPVPGGKGATDVAKSLRKGASGKGKDKFIFRKSVKIPARNFDDWTKEDELELAQAYMNKVAEVLVRD